MSTPAEKACKARSYIKHRAKVLAKVKEYRLANPLKIRERYLKVRYNLTIDGWEQLFAFQEKACKICKSQEPSGKGWHVDHDHQTGKIRGILCHHCNTALGLLKDSSEIAEKVVQYLKGF